MDLVCRPVDVMHALGVRTILFTNAAGGLLPDMNPGDLVAVSRVRLWPYRAWAHAPETLDPAFVTDGCDFIGDLQWMHGPLLREPAPRSPCYSVSAPRRWA